MKKNSHSTRMRGLSGLMLGMITFLIFAPFNPIAAGAFAVGFASLPYMPMPANILGTTAPAGETEAQKAERLFIEKVKTDAKASVDEFIKAHPMIVKMTAFETQLNGITEQLTKTLKPEEAATLKAEVDKLITDMKSLTDVSVKGSRHKKGSIAETLEANKAKLDAFLTGSKAGLLDLEVKATETSTDIDDRHDFAQWHENAAVGQLPVRRPFMRELFTNVNASMETIKYIDQNTAVRDAKNVALCGVTTSDTKLTWKTRQIQIEKVRDFVDICLDMMNDYGFVQGEIDRLLNTSLELKIDNGLLLGDGISPNLHSVDEIASTFSAAGTDAETNYTGMVQYATLIDLISVAGAQIRSYGKNNMWFPNVVLLNPRDSQLMKLLKDNMKNYIKGNTLRPSLIQGANGTWYVDGMLIIENSLVPANEFYIGDFRKGTLYNKGGVGIELSYENRSNFETETVTAKVYKRQNLLIRNVDANAFMHCEDIEAGVFDISVPT